jgi:hypothetical protein
MGLILNIIFTAILKNDSCSIQEVHNINYIYIYIYIYIINIKKIDALSSVCDIQHNTYTD